MTEATDPTFGRVTRMIIIYRAFNWVVGRRGSVNAS